MTVYIIFKKNIFQTEKDVCRGQTTHTYTYFWNNSETLALREKWAMDGGRDFSIKNQDPPLPSTGRGIFRRIFLYICMHLCICVYIHIGTRRLVNPSLLAAAYHPPPVTQCSLAPLKNDGWINDVTGNKKRTWLPFKIHQSATFLDLHAPSKWIDEPLRHSLQRDKNWEFYWSSILSRT